MTPDLIQRLFIARQTQFISRDLADEVLGVLPLALPLATRQAARNTLIRQAASRLPGCTEQKANRLAELARRLQHPVDEVRTLLYWARLFDGLPKHPRSFRRIIEKHLFDTQPIVLSEKVGDVIGHETDQHSTF